MAAQRRITAIVPRPSNPDRLSVRVDGKAVVVLSSARVAELGLQVGQAWDESLAQQADQAAAFDKALKRAMNRLAARAMSRRTLDRKLRDLGYDEPVRQRVLDRLTQLGYLDDEAYARAVIRDILARKPAGPFLLRQKLMQKGLDRDIIDRLVSEELGGVDSVEQAVDLARRRLRQMSRLDPPTRKRRLYGLLARRGFDPDTITAALTQLQQQIDASS